MLYPLARRPRNKLTTLTRSTHGSSRSMIGSAIRTAATWQQSISKCALPVPCPPDIVLLRPEAERTAFASI
jgi:hypothetical protein